MSKKGGRAKKGLFQSQTGQSFPGVGQLKEAALSAKVKSSSKKRDSSQQQSKSKLGFKMNKNLGQHLLKNPGIVAKIVSAAEIKRSDVVLEIGPGTGNLTVQLCALARKVRALELDPRMVAEVKKRCLASGYSNLEVVQGDALKTDFGEFQVCTANLPYQISSPFIFRLLSHPSNFRAAILMFQKEFGERLVAQPGEKQYCRLGVNTQLFCTVTRVCHVAAASFNPPPKVDSIVVKLAPKRDSQKIHVDYGEWDGMLRILFSRKRKTLRAVFRTTKTAQKLLNLHKAFLSSQSTFASSSDGGNELQKFKNLLNSVLDQLDFAQSRAVNMTSEQFMILLHSFHAQGIRFPVEVGKKKHNLADKTISIPSELFIDNAKEEEMDGEDEEEDEMMGS